MKEGAFAAGGRPFTGGAAAGAEVCTNGAGFPEHAHTVEERTNADAKVAKLIVSV